jgi:hypothetical protein
VTSYNYDDADDDYEPIDIIAGYWYKEKEWLNLKM